MFNKIYKFLKTNILLPNIKQKYRIWLAKDLKQYKREYRNLLSHFISNNWILGNKVIDIEQFKLKRFSKLIVIIIIFIIIYYLI